MTSSRRAACSTTSASPTRPPTALEVTYGGRSNPLSAAFGGGFLLSDDPYGSFAPFDFLQADLLYLPSVAVGRLIETPADVSAAIAAFTDANGVLRPRQGVHGRLRLRRRRCRGRARAARSRGRHGQRRAAQRRSFTGTRDPWTGPDAIAGINDAAGGYTFRQRPLRPDPHAAGQRLRRRGGR